MGFGRQRRANRGAEPPQECRRCVRWLLGCGTRSVRETRWPRDDDSGEGGFGGEDPGYNGLETTLARLWRLGCSRGTTRLDHSSGRSHLARDVARRQGGRVLRLKRLDDTDNCVGLDVTGVLDGGAS